MNDIAELGFAVDSTGLTKGERALDRMDQAGKRVEKQSKRVSKEVKGTTSAVKYLFAGAVAFAGAKVFSGMLDELSGMNARLKLVTKSNDNFNKTQRELYSIAQLTRSPIKETTDLYSRMAIGTKGTNIAQKDLLKTVDLTSKSLKIGGASTQEAASATLQLSQALASGKLQGDEFKSLMETAPSLMQSVAAGIGVPIGALKNLASEGELTSGILIKAIMSQSDAINREFGQIPKTIGGAMLQAKNYILNSLSSADIKNGISNKIVTGLELAGGAALAFVGHVSGAFSSIQTALIGFTPYLSDAAGFFSSMYAAIEPVLPITGQFVSVMAGGIATFIAASTAISGISAALLIVKAALLANPLTLALSAIAAAAYVVYDNWEPIKKYFIDLSVTISAKFRLLSNDLEIVWLDIRNKFATIVGGVELVTANIVDSMKRKFAELIGTVSDFLVKYNNGVADAVIPDSVVDSVRDFSVALQESVSTAEAVISKQRLASQAYEYSRSKLIQSSAAIKSAEVNRRKLLATESEALKTTKDLSKETDVYASKTNNLKIGTNGLGKAFKSTTKYGKELLGGISDLIGKTNQLTSIYGNYASATDEVNHAIIDLAKSETRRKGILDDIKNRVDAGTSSQKEANKILERTGVVSETTTTTIRDHWERTTDSLYTNLEGFFETGLKGWDSFADGIKGIFKKMIASMLAQWAASGITKLFSSLASGKGFDFSGFSISSAFGSSGKSSAGNGVAAAGAIFGQNAGKTFNTVATGAGGVVGVVGGYNQIDQGLEQGGTSGAISVVSGIASLYQGATTVAGLLSGGATAAATAATAATATAASAATAATSAALASTATATVGTAAAASAATVGTAATASASAATAAATAASGTAASASTAAAAAGTAGSSVGTALLSVAPYLAAVVAVAAIASDGHRRRKKLKNDQYSEVQKAIEEGRTDVVDLGDGLNFQGGTNENTTFFGAEQFDKAGIDGIAKILKDRYGFDDAGEAGDGVLRLEDHNRKFSENNDTIVAEVQASIAEFKLQFTEAERTIIGSMGNAFKQTGLSASDAFSKIDSIYDASSDSGLSASQRIINAYSEAFGKTTEEAESWLASSEISADRFGQIFDEASGEALTNLLGMTEKSGQAITGLGNISQVSGGVISDAFNSATSNIFDFATGTKLSLDEIGAASRASATSVRESFAGVLNGVDLGQLKPIDIPSVSVTAPTGTGQSIQVPHIGNFASALSGSETINFDGSSVDSLRTISVNNREQGVITKKGSIERIEAKLNSLSNNSNDNNSAELRELIIAVRENTEESKRLRMVTIAA